MEIPPLPQAIAVLQYSNLQEVFSTNLNVILQKISAHCFSSYPQYIKKSTYFSFCIFVCLKTVTVFLPSFPLWYSKPSFFSFFCLGERVFCTSDHWMGNLRGLVPCCILCFRSILSGESEFCYKLVLPGYSFFIVCGEHWHFLFSCHWN